MPLQKIVSFKGKKFFQCLHSGVLVEKCYALPDRDRYWRRSNGGSFADGACAVAWLEDQKSQKKVSEKKFEYLMEGMRKEFLQEILISAPDMSPEFPYWGYREEHPWVLQEGLISIPSLLHLPVSCHS
jgi:hypothetical protein